jgi:hypothetical protein
VKVPGETGPGKVKGYQVSEKFIGEQGHGRQKESRLYEGRVQGS